MGHGIVSLSPKDLVLIEWFVHRLPKRQQIIFFFLVEMKRDKPSFIRISDDKKKPFKLSKGFVSFSTAEHDLNPVFHSLFPVTFLSVLLEAVSLNATGLVLCHLFGSFLRCKND